MDVTTTEGARLLHHPAPAWGDPAALANGCGQLVSAETLPHDSVEPRIDLRYVVSVMMLQSA